MYLAPGCNTMIDMSHDHPVVLAYVDGASVQEVCESVGVTYHRARKLILDAGVMRSRAGRSKTEGRTHKRCPRCAETKSVEAFGRRKNPNGSWGLHGYCKPCNTDQNRVWRVGLTQEQLDEMTAAQDGLCAICNLPPKGEGPLFIDHDHQTGQVRELLCPACNFGLGQFGDDIDRMLKAIAYVRKHKNGGR